MKTYNLIESLSVLGDTMRKLGRKEGKDSFHPKVTVDFYDQFNHAIKSAEIYNKWFTEEAVRESLLNFGNELTAEKLEGWLAKYKPVDRSKAVGLILAGNIPLVGFHDVISTLLSGNKAIIKLSRDDKILIPALLSLLVDLNPAIKEKFEIVERLNEAEAIIATGSDNSARYFEKYFGHLPCIIRKNRTSIAVLNGAESEEDLQLLGKDIFTFFGLGCRNVSHLLIPKDYNLDKVFGAIISHSDIINHHKYCNNYDYYKAIFLMNQEPILENGFLLTRETEELFAPIAVLHYHFYENEEEKLNYLEAHKEKIQAVIGKGYLPFGEAQCPRIDEYADGVDTMAFLTNL